MTTIITITVKPITVLGDGYDYTEGDRILQNIISGEYEIIYSGQNQGMEDYKLINSVEEQSPFRIYYRTYINTPFIYLGSTTISTIIHRRLVSTGINSIPNQRLQIKLIILPNNIINQEIETLFIGSGKFKKAILQHSNFNINQNTNIGFYKE